MRELFLVADGRDKVLQRPEDQGQRGLEIMRHIGEEAHLRGIEFLQLGTLEFFHLQFVREPDARPEEVDRKVLKITFNNNGKVAQIVRLSKEDGKNITPSEDKTEVRGQDPGFFRKYFGGVGQYNPFAGQNTPGL